jgi:phage-related protein
MTKPVFTWNPDVGSQQDVKPNVNVTKFGDGYELRVAAGINNKPQSWSLKFERNYDICNAVVAFLKARGGVESFTWTNPLGETGTFVCRSYKTQQNVGTMEVTATFEQVFEY